MDPGVDTHEELELREARCEITLRKVTRVCSEGSRVEDRHRGAAAHLIPHSERLDRSTPAHGARASGQLLCRPLAAPTNLNYEAPSRLPLEALRRDGAGAGAGVEARTVGSSARRPAGESGQEPGRTEDASEGGRMEAEAGAGIAGCGASAGWLAENLHMGKPSSVRSHLSRERHTQNQHSAA